MLTEKFLGEKCRVGVYLNTDEFVNSIKASGYGQLIMAHSAGKITVFTPEKEEEISSTLIFALLRTKFPGEKLRLFTNFLHLYQAVSHYVNLEVEPLTEIENRDRN